VTYFHGMYRFKNKLKRPEYEMVSLNLETGKCKNDIIFLI
jgi:hypothetical protein